MTFSSLAALSTVQVKVNLTGNIETDDPTLENGGQVNLFQDNTSFFDGTSIFAENSAGPVDTSIWSNPIDVVNGMADIAFRLQTQTFIFIDSLVPDSTFTTAIDFFNTLEVIDIIGFDSNGNEVFITEATGNSGTTFVSRTAPPTTDIPEPATIVLLGMGLVALRYMRRRQTA